MVQMSKVGAMNQMIDSIFAPILNKLVDEGFFFGWGQFNHAWGDEWNVNFWYVTKDVASFYAGWNDYVKRVGERHPGAFGEAVKYFQAHKDNTDYLRKLSG